MNAASIRLIKSMAMTATGITAMNLPITPDTNNSGMKAITVVITDVVTAGITSYVPSTAAWTNDLPICRCS